MIQIETVEIKYFRSMYTVVIRNLRDVVVFSGKNDCGKSNILRALNLFFNNQTGWNEPLDFQRDFCRRRLQECRKKVKSKQFIRVKVVFRRGARYEKSLPERFWVSRTWNRDSAVATERNSLREGNVPAMSLDRALASLQRYLGTIRFEYIPAIKDRSFFSYSLGILQDAILQSRRDTSLKTALTGLNATVRDEADKLHQEFAQVSGVEIDIHLPDNLEELFRAFAVSTGGSDSLPLAMRGDGIQARFLPSLLYHVASRSKKHFIWGFEEPENCLEHALATRLADDITQEYADESQILLTSHSPAFVTLDTDNSSAYRVYLNDRHTSITPFGSSTEELNRDLGLIALQRHYQADYLQEMETLQAANETLAAATDEATSPILLVEGKTDVLILDEAWRRLRANQGRPFRILSCNIARAEDDGDSKAGCGVLSKALQSCRTDQPTMVGLFDYDQEGMNAFKLDKNFSPVSLAADVKISSNEHVAAVLLPDTHGKEQYREAKNLSIEFLFPEQCITKMIRGKGLVLEQKKEQKRIESHVISEQTTVEPHFRKIMGGKAWFAERVVPTFDNEESGNPYRGQSCPPIRHLNGFRIRSYGYNVQ